MSEYTDYYPTWLGNGAFGAAGVRLRDQEPIVFRPTDISGCAMWFDANDSFSVNYNNLQIVSSWSNKGTIGGQFDISGDNVVLYGAKQINGLNVVSFSENSFMQGKFTLDFQAKSMFFVTRENITPSGIANPWISSDTTNGLEAFSLRNGALTYFIGKHPSPIPSLAFDSAVDYIGIANLTEFINASDASDNWVGINGLRYPEIYSVAATGYNTSNIIYFLGGYFGGSTIAADQDMCEIIIYDHAISEPERIQVEAYLRAKWNLQEPIPPTPPPFLPTDISGLYIWMDANNQSSLSLDLSNNVLSWSNLGLASNVFASNTGTATVIQDPAANSNYVMVFPSGGTDLATTATLPYVDRTQFVVFNNISNLPGELYPYISFIQSYTNSCMQTGATWDAGSSNYYITMCQQGQNCPLVGPVPSLNTCNYSLAIFVNDSANLSNNLVYFNGGSNINIGTDLGNLFLQTAESYYINNSNASAPANVICEILEYNSFLSASNISTAANYLVNKWAISSFTTIS